MVWLFAFMISLTFLSIFYTVNETDDLSASNRFVKLCNILLAVNLIPAWIAVIAFAFVDINAIFWTAMLWSIALIIASIVTMFQNRLYGLGNLVCYGSYFALLIVSCSGYEDPTLSPAIQPNGRYCYVDREAYCSPIVGNDNKFTIYASSQASFRTVCDICNGRYSAHHYEQYTETEYAEKLRQDSIFAETMLPDYMPY